MQAGVSLKHFRRLIGPRGLYQHADENEPLLSEGYCTDDNARAVQVLVRLLPLLPKNQRKGAENLLALCWQFLRESEASPGVLVNFRDADGRWQPRKPESEDMYARAVRCLVEVVAYKAEGSRRQAAIRMLNDLAERIKDFVAPRAWVEILIALAVLENAGFSWQKSEGLRQQGYRFVSSLWQGNSSSSWPWFEPVMTYANALFPHALLALRAQIDSSDLDKMLEASANFLVASTIRDGIFVPIGSDGWYPKGGQPSQENQQPIEAGLMFDFLVDYQQVFPDRVLPEIVAAPYLWFFGRNTGQVVMVDVNEGASYDGLFASGPNRHRGAESMLAYLWCEVRLAEAEDSLRKFILEK